MKYSALFYKRFNLIKNIIKEREIIFFGSFTRKDYNPHRSDIDVMVMLQEEDNVELLKQQLEQLSFVSRVEINGYGGGGGSGPENKNIEISENWDIVLITNLEAPCYQINCA